MASIDLTDLPQEIADQVAAYLDHVQIQNLCLTSKAMNARFISSYYRDYWIHGANEREEFMQLIRSESWKFQGFIRDLRIVFGVDEERIIWTKPYKLCTRVPPHSGPDVCQVIQEIAKRMPRCKIKLKLVEAHFRRFADRKNNKHSHRFPNVTRIIFDYPYGWDCRAPEFMNFLNKVKAPDGHGGSTLVQYPKPSLCFQSVNGPGILFEDPDSLEQFLNKDRYPDLEMLKVCTDREQGGNTESGDEKSYTNINRDFVTYRRPCRGTAKVTLIDHPDVSKNIRILDTLLVENFSRFGAGNPLHNDFFHSDATLNLRSLMIVNCNFNDEQLQYVLDHLHSRTLKRFALLELALDDFWENEIHLARYDDQELVRQRSRIDCDRCDIFGDLCGRLESVDLLLPWLCCNVIEALCTPNCHCGHGLEKENVRRVRRLVWRDGLCDISPNK